ncbi:MAG TPA: thioester domain-containing protein [Mycobacteriales bacterium]|jgi:LPXTG-motif cell wall-anchored protein|nr:thioester domain-containing protein [Mycobacteriales bacterium]
MSVPSPRFIRTSCVLTIAAFTLGLPAVASAEGPSDNLAPITGLAKVVTGTVDTQSLTDGNTPTLMRGASDTDSTVSMLDSGVLKNFNAQQLLLNNGESRQLQAYRLSPQEKAGEPQVGKGSGVKLGETPLSSVGLDDQKMSKVTWLLAQTKAAGDDKSSLDKLADSVSSVTGLDLGTVTPKQRSAATQAAVWHFTKGMELDPQHNDSVVTSLYNYLVGPANVGAPLPTRRAAPLSTVPLAGSLPTADELPPALAPDAGSVSGPFKVSPDSPGVGLEASGNKDPQVVNSKGAVIDKAAPGEEFFLKMPKDASAQPVVVSAISQQKDVTGRVVTDLGHDTHKQPTQLVLQDGPALPVQQPVTLNWVPDEKAAQAGSSNSAAGSYNEAKPSEVAHKTKHAATDHAGGLPVTGAAVGGIVALGVVLLGGGGLLFLSSRRKKAAAVATPAE